MRWYAVIFRTDARDLLGDKHGAVHDENVVWHFILLSPPVNQPTATVVWCCGLPASGSGKSTVAARWKSKCVTSAWRVSTYLLDGDNVRHGLC